MNPPVTLHFKDDVGEIRLEYIIRSDNRISGVRIDSFYPLQANLPCDYQIVHLRPIKSQNDDKILFNLAKFGLNHVFLLKNL